MKRVVIKNLANSFEYVVEFLGEDYEGLLKMVLPEGVYELIDESGKFLCFIVVGDKLYL